MDSMINVAVNTSACVKYLGDVAAKQLPYAAMVALNNTAFLVKADEVTALSTHLDRPTPFTQRAYEVVKASKARLTASVRARAIQGAYLSWQVDGGTRGPKARAIVLPRDVRLNAYGNMTKGAVKSMLKDKARYFSGSPRGGGVAGIWRRMGTKGKSKGRGKLTLMVAYTGQASYKPRLPFMPIAEVTVGRVFRGEFMRAFGAALVPKGV